MSLLAIFFPGCVTDYTVDAAINLSCLGKLNLGNVLTIHEQLALAKICERYALHAILRLL